jgi:hypothetical protein
VKTDLRVRVVYRDGLLAQVAEGYTPIMKGQTAIDIEDALQKLKQNNRLSKQKRRYDDEEPSRIGIPRLILALSGHARPQVRFQTGGEQLRITTNQDIAGYPALKVRNFIKSYRSGGSFHQAAEAALDLRPEAAATLLLKLVELGLIEEVEKRIDGELIFQATNYGRALANASAAKPIYRKTGDRILEQFLKRVHTVNATSKYLYRLEAVVLFGSMLSDVERLGDVDDAIDLQPKVTEETSFQEWCMARRRVAEAERRSFRTTFEWATWPKLEILLLLKALSRSLSLHELQQLTRMANVSYYVLLGDPGRIGRLISGGPRVISRHSPMRC